MPVDRASSQSAAEVFTRLIPIPEHRSAAIATLADVIKHISPHADRWSVTLKRKLIRVNTGNILVFDVVPDHLRVVFDGAAVTPDQRAALAERGVTLGLAQFAAFPTFEVAKVPAAELASLWPMLAPVSRIALDAGVAWGRCPFRGAHSPGVLRFLEESGQTLPPPPPDGSSSVRELLQRSYASEHLSFTDDQIACFFTALQVKGFVILSGISGTGKSKLAQHFIRAISERELAPRAGGDEEMDPITSDDGDLQGLRLRVPAAAAASQVIARQLFLPVRPDWRDGTELLGFYNPVTEAYESRAFVEFLEDAVEAWERREPQPYVVILDEMNLARVEYYFADLLSVLESGRRADGFTEEAIAITYPDAITSSEAPRRRLHLPPNLFIIGTINSDETTHAFSPKVLDRAFTIVLNDVDFDTDFDEDSQPLAGSERRRIADVFTTGGTFPRTDHAAAAVLKEAHPEVREYLQDLTDGLRRFDLHFGHRVYNEIVMFLVHAERNGLFGPGPDGFAFAFDAAVLMKVLPKFHGSRARLEKPLLTMLRWCVNPTADLLVEDEAYATIEAVLTRTAYETEIKFPETALRIQGMLRTLASAGFASFG